MAQYSINRPVVFKVDSGQIKTLNTRQVKLQYQAKGTERKCFFRKVLYTFAIKIKST